MRESDDWIMPVNDFHPRCSIAREENPDDWFVEPGELPPGVDAVLVFDLIDQGAFVDGVEEDGVDLAPPPSVVIAELDPWRLDVP